MSGCDVFDSRIGVTERSASSGKSKRGPVTRPTARTSSTPAVCVVECPLQLDSVQVVCGTPVSVARRMTLHPSLVPSMKDQPPTGVAEARSMVRALSSTSGSPRWSTASPGEMVMTEPAVLPARPQLTPNPVIRPTSRSRWRRWVVSSFSSSEVRVCPLTNSGYSLSVMV